MMKRIISLVVCAAALIAALGTGAFASFEGDGTMTVSVGNGEVEIEQGELSEWEAEVVAWILAQVSPIGPGSFQIDYLDYPPGTGNTAHQDGADSTDGLQGIDGFPEPSEDPADAGSVDEPGDLAVPDDTVDSSLSDVEGNAGASDDSVPRKGPQSDGSHFCEGEHDLYVTTAYYTRHFAFADAPRCAVYTLKVSVCRKCDYIERELISAERVSYCHGGALTFGDVNADTKVNARDVVHMMRFIVEGRQRSNSLFDPYAADFNSDAKINARDVTLLMRMIVRADPV